MLVFGFGMGCTIALKGRNMPLDGMDGVMKRMNLSNTAVGCGLMNTDKKMYMGRARAGVVGRGINDKQAIELYEAYLKEIKP